MEVRDLSDLLGITNKSEPMNVATSKATTSFAAQPRVAFQSENFVKVTGAERLSDVLFSHGLSDAHIYIPKRNVPTLNGCKVDVPMCRVTRNGIINAPFPIDIDRKINEGSMFIMNDSDSQVRRIRVTRGLSMDKTVEHIFIRILPMRAFPPESTGASKFFELFGARPMHEGLILISGRTGSGKSSLLASILQEYINKYPVHVLTIEDPIEYALYEGIGYATQKEIGSDVIDYPTALRTAMRETPHIILVGEIRDEETALSVLNAAETGHLVFGTIHAQGESGTVERMLGLASNVKGINQRIAQTLKVCVNVDKSGGNFLYSFTRITEAVRNVIVQGTLQHWKNYAKEEEINLSVKRMV